MYMYIYVMYMQLNEYFKIFMHASATVLYNSVYTLDVASYTFLHH